MLIIHFKGPQTSTLRESCTFEALTVRMTALQDISWTNVLGKDDHFKGHLQLTPIRRLCVTMCGTSLWPVHRCCRVMQPGQSGSGHFIWHITAVTCSSSAVGHFHSNITEDKQVVIGCRCRSRRITYRD